MDIENYRGNKSGLLSFWLLCLKKTILLIINYEFILILNGLFLKLINLESQTPEVYNCLIWLTIITKQ